MARPQVADGRDGLQIWRISANILNKQSRTAYTGWSSGLGVGRGANNSSSKFVTKCYKGHVGEKMNAYRILAGKPERKRPLGIPRPMWEENIKMALRDRIGWYGLD
jgi:hypothetical protein